MEYRDLIVSVKAGNGPSTASNSAKTFVSRQIYLTTNKIVNLVESLTAGS